MNKSVHILLVEDNPGDALLIRKLLAEQSGSTDLDHVTTLAACLERLHQHSYDVVLLDLGLPDSNGIATFEKLIESEKSVPVIILTGLDDEEIALKAVAGGAQDFLAKSSINSTILNKSINYAIERHKLICDRIEAEKQFETLFESSPDGCLLIENNRFIKCNQAAVAMLHAESKEQILNTHPSTISPEIQPDGRNSFEKAEELLATIIETGSLHFEWLHKRMDGEVFPADVSLTLIRDGERILVYTVWRDISERKQAEEERLNLEKQLLKAQRHESLGVLAGGIAHDFNNLLTAIIGNAELALMRLNPESPAVDNLKRIEQASARAADLAKQMLAYSGKGKFVVEQLDMSRIVEEMLRMLEVSISKKAVLRFNLTHPLPSVEADAIQIRQIIMNLVINASEAIGDKSGVITIATGCMDCDRSYLKDVWLDENLTGGLYVFLEIADNGCGMDKETLSKLFDPFFTTKFTGRGLGMAAVLGIVRGHKGAIKVYSEQGKGTSLKVLFPASDRPVELFNGNNQTDNWQGNGTVLLVDD